MAYCSQSEVLYEAGMLDREKGKTLTGAANGSNAVFYTEKTPLVDNNYDDAVDTTDVVVYDDGAAVTVSAIVAGSGRITLSAAPASNSVITADYATSEADSTMVAQYISEAEEWINEEMEQITTVPYDSIDTNPVVTPLPNSIRKICRTYAAGLLMVAEYGTQSMTTETEKEGKRKIELAERWLKEYRMRVENNDKTSTGADAPSANADVRLFEEYDPSTGWHLPSDADVTLNGTT